MSFNLDEFTQIISSIDRLFYMSESEPVINISIGYYDTECTQLFRKLSFSLKHGTAEIKIYDYTGFFSYIDLNGETLINIRFKDNISEYQKVLTQILALDRQQIDRVQIAVFSDDAKISEDKLKLPDSSVDSIRKIIAEEA